MTKALTPPAWTAQALCAQVDPELFFPPIGANGTAAKRVCMKCPVRIECLQEALERDEEYGIFGGLSRKQRAKLRRGRVAA